VLRTASAGSNAPAQQIYPIRQGEVHWDWKDRPEGPVVRFSEVEILADRSCSSLSPDDIAEAVEEAVLSYSDPSGQASSTSESPRLLDFFPSSTSQEDFLSYHDVRLAESGSGCASCASGTLTQSKAIEVGHTFILGTRYSQSLGYQFAARPEVDAVTGKQKAQERHYFQMGCYGIGVTRLMGVLAMKARRSFLALQQPQETARVASKGDGVAGPKPGFLWPRHLAPYSHVVLLPPSAATQSQQEVDTLLARFQSEVEDATGDAVEEGNISVLVDDRSNLSMGAKLTEADLTGAGEVWVVGKEGGRRVR
jgi:prolyl-tRNA synthetase